MAADIVKVTVEPIFVKSVVNAETVKLGVSTVTPYATALAAVLSVYSTAHRSGIVYSVDTVSAKAVNGITKVGSPY
jgi:hypothetical protein